MLAWVVMQTARHAAPSAHIGERVVTSVGLIASGSGLLSLLACGLGWSCIPDFFSLWLVLGTGGLLLGPWIDRRLRPLFWLA